MQSEMRQTISLISISWTKLYHLYAGENAIPLSYTNDAYIISSLTHDLVCFVCVFPLYQYHLSNHYRDVMKSAMVSKITDVSIVCSTVFSVADRRKHQSSALLACVRGIHQWPVNSPHKEPVTRKNPFDDVIMEPNQVTSDCEYLPWNILKWISVVDLPELFNIIPLLLK